MMPLIVSKKIKQAVLASILIFIVPVTQAWVTPVVMDLEHEGSGGAAHTITTTGIPEVDIDRCDTAVFNSSLLTKCHRRNLVWQLGSKDVGGFADPMAQWNPQLGDDVNWRLPTIKELARLVDYSNITATGGALTEQLLILNMFPADAPPAFSLSDSWLISSTHRDIDGDATNNQAQIFGINMGTGEIAAFDTVVSEVDDGDVTAETVAHTNPSSVLIGDVITVSDSTAAGTQTIIAISVDAIISTDEINEEIVVDGVQTTQTITLEKCTELDVDGICTTTVDVNVYALLVHTQTVSQLTTP